MGEAGKAKINLQADSGPSSERATSWFTEAVFHLYLVEGVERALQGHCPSERALIPLS